MSFSRHSATTGRFRLWCAAVAGSVVASLFVAPPVSAAPPSWPTPAAPAAGSSVPVSPVGARAAAKAPSETGPRWSAAAPSWPAGGDGVVEVDTATAGAARSTRAQAARVGGLGLAVRGNGGDSLNERALVHGAAVGTAAAAPGSVKVSVADRAATEAAGVKGVLFTVLRADGTAGASKVALDLDYAGFADAYGADYGGRLRLVRLPSCALSTPELPQCRIQTPVPGAVNVAGNKVVSVDAVDVGGQDARTFAAKGGSTPSVPAAGAQGPGRNELDKGIAGAAEARSTNGTPQTTAASMSGQPVYALAATSASAQGDFAHTTLSPTYSWAAGSQGGEFSYNVPITMPPVSAGPKPTLALQYSSSTVDGKTTSTNNQASWVGEGWDLQTGYIERSYRLCAEDGGTTGDLCWFTDKVITMVFNGRSTRLIKDDNTGVWHPEADDGSKVELLTNEVANGDYFKDYWRITTQDGTQYSFGKHKRYATDPDATNSVQKVLVYGNNAGEPCNVAGQPWNSGCDRAYRWNLDYVVDPAGNSMTYFYERYQGKYGNYNGANNWVYDLTARLKRIDYGARAGSEGTSAPVARVNLVENPRCDPASSGCSSYPDVPWDQYCPTTQTTPCSQYTPTYWTPWQLAMINTEVYDVTTGAYRQVDSYFFRKTFPSPNDGTAPALWFEALYHTGRSGPAGADITLPPMLFGGEAKANRVNNGTSNHFRMTYVTTGSGEQIHVTYKPTECTPASVGTYTVDQNTHMCFVGNGSWFHKYLVDSVITSDLTGTSPDEVTSYTYSTAGSTVPALWRLGSNEAATSHVYDDFAGFPTVRTEHGPVGGQRTVTEKLYHRALAGDTLLNGTQRQVWVVDSSGTQTYDYGQVRGSVREERTYDGTTLRGKTFHTWRFAGPNGYDNPTATRTGTWSGAAPAKAYQAVEYETTTRTLLSGGAWRWTKQTRDFDTYGMPKSVTDHGDAGTAATADNVGKAADDTCTTITYARDISRWLVSYPSQTVTTDCTSSPTGANYLSGMQTRYDGGAVGSMPTKGLVTRTNTLSDVSGTTLTWTQASRTEYDALGRITGEYDALEHGTTTAYTPTGVGPVTGMKITNPLGHVTSSTVDPSRAEVLQIVDPNNRVTTMQYDSLGRLTKVYKPHTPAVSTPDLQYTYIQHAGNAYGVSTKTLAANGTQVETFEVYDGKLRPKQTQTPSLGAAGGRVVTDVTYDGRGLATRSSTLWNSGAPSGTLVSFADTAVTRQTRTAYDLMGRPTTVGVYSANALKSQTTVTYDGERTTVVPPDGGATRTITDAGGRATSVLRYPTASPTGTAETTTYAYDRVGRLKTLIDPAGNQTGYTYDRDGQLLTTTDPDVGTTTNVYDNAGRLTSTTDARTQKISTDYDNLDRPTARWAGNSGTGTKLATWTYDTLAKGEPTSSTRWVGSDQYTTAITGYNDSYQPTGQTTTVPMVQGALAGSYTTSFGYDSVGHLTSLRYPAGGGLAAETVTFGYTTLGAPSTVTGIDPYVTATSYTELNELSQRVYGTSGIAQLTRQYAYEPATGRLATIRSLLPNQAQAGQFTTVQNDTYAYTATGDVTRITDGTDNQSQCYRYDGQHRLTEAWTAVDACTASPTTAAIAGSGKYPYWDSWTVDSAGRRTTDVHRASATDVTTRTHTYPAAGAARTHAATSVKYTGAVTRTDTMTYDAAGNTKTRSINGIGTDYTFNSENQFATATVHALSGDQVTNHLYDADGGLLIRKEPGGSTLYTAGQEYKAVGGAVTATRYYSSGESAVAVRTSAGKRWLAADHQASANLTVDAATGAVQRRWYTPYGADRAVNGTWPTDRGFLNKQTNTSTGLIDVGAREYDANLGVFLSPDPLVDPNDPKSFNAYAYSHHNPVTLSDPSGLCPADRCEGYGQNPGQSTGVKAKPGPHGIGVDYQPDSANPADLEREKARLAAEAAKQQLIDAAIALGKIVLDELGITAGFDCFFSGDMGACAETAVNVALSLVGGFAGKIAAKYLIRIKQGVKLVNKVWNLVNKLIDGVKGWLKNSKLFKKLDEVAETATKQSDDLPGCTNSFQAGTLVLLADGTTRPIETLKVGDVVLTTDPVSGTTEPHEITQLHVNDDKEFTDLTVTAGTDAGAAINTTREHPFWSVTRNAWTHAGALNPGERLQTDDGTAVDVLTRTNYTGARTMYNLTVATIHTYYVVTGILGVLVHNTGPGCDLPKPPTGRGSVPPAERDPQRLFSRNQVQDKLDENGSVCAKCGEPLELGNAKGHHVQRHADGGATDPDNLAVLCEACHKEIHRR